MATLNPGIYGAKRQSWENCNPRDVLRDKLRDNPSASEAEIEKLVWDVICEEQGYYAVIFKYWFANNYRYFFTSAISSGVGVSDTGTKKRSSRCTKIDKPTRAEIDAAKEKLRPILMNHILSTGKPLSASTYGDCTAEGGWLQDVGKLGRSNEIVRLTEKKLWVIRTRKFKK